MKKLPLSLLLCAILCFFLWPAQAQTISTVAGLGVGFNGDGIAATAANLESGSNGILADAYGNVFYTDYNQGRVRKISPSGIVTTVVGEGTLDDWWSVTGGPATASRTPWLSSLALDNNGNILIGSEGIIWRLDTSGYLHVLAGTGSFGDAGDGGMATDANVMAVSGLAVDAVGNVYFTDVNAQKVRKIDTAGIISTVAGDGTRAYGGDGGAATAAQINWPSGIAVNASGEVIFSDAGNNRLRKINTSGVISTIVGNDTAGFSGDGGPSTAAKTNYPMGVMIDGAGNILFADAGNNRIRVISSAGVISTMFGSGTASFCGDGGAAGSACLNFPSSIAADLSGNIYIKDVSNNRIRKVNTSGTISTIAGHTSHARYSGDGGSASSAEINGASSVVADNYGNTYIADAGNARIRKVNASGIITSFAGSGIGGHSGDGGSATSARIDPSKLAADSLGNIYFTESNYIRKISISGVLTTIAGGGTSTSDGVAATAANIQPRGLCSDAAGNLFFTDGNRVRLLNTSGVVSTVGGSITSGSSGDGGPATAATFDSPGDLALDHLHNLYVCDNNNHTIRKISAAGIITNVAGSYGTYTHCSGCYYMMAAGNGIGMPTALAVDEHGNIYFSELFSHTVSRVDTFGVLHKLAGIDGNEGFLGDGGAAYDAHLYGVSGLAVDHNGHLLIAENNNSTVRSVSLCTGVPAMTAAYDPTAICLGDSSAISRYSAADDFTWSCADTTLTLSMYSRYRGEVDLYATARAAGTAHVIISVRDICGSSSSDTIRINVGGSLAGTAVIPHTICVGSSAVCTDSLATGSWSSSAPGIASISATGTITGIASGTALISFLGTTSCGSGIDTQTVVVTPSVSAGTISGSSSVCVGSSTTLTATVTGGTWTSSAAAIASVSATGVVYGAAAGTATISYSVTSTCGTAIATHTITVNPLPSAGSISGSTSVCVAATLSLSSSVTGGTWLSATPSIASVSTSGTVTGIAGGTATIYYIVSGACGTDTARTTVTVTPLPVAGTITGGPGICMGATGTLTSSATGGTWSTSDATIASISTTGTVYSVAVGTATISYSVTGTCGSSTATQTLSVYALPAVSVATSSSCGGNTILIGSGATVLTWSPGTGLSCTVCDTVYANPTATTNYTVTGTNSSGCSDTANVTVNGNRISGHVTFSAAAPDTLDTKVWLIQFTASDSSLTATDSTTTCLDGGVPYFEFMNEPTGNYMVKGALIHGNVPGTSGYIPTYSDSTINWYAATVASHTSGTDNLNITMLYGTVPSGPGFIGGSVVSGAGKGTAGEVPERGMIIYLKNATGDVVTYVYTDAAGNYSFNGLAYGTYYVYPADFSYYTTPSGAITLSSSTPSVTGIKFKKYTTSGIIIPLETTGFTTVNTTGSNVTVYPNPTNGELMINWNKAISGGATFTVTDVAGRVVYTNKWTLTQSTSYHEQLPTLVTGMYQVTITSSDFYYNGKLMVQQ